MRSVISIFPICFILIFLWGCITLETPTAPTPEVPNVQITDSITQSATEVPLPVPTPTTSAPVIIPTLSFIPTKVPLPVALNLTPATMLPQLASNEDAAQALTNHTARNASITIMGESEPLLFGDAWCAKSQQILDENLKHINWSFAINGQNMPLDQFTRQTYQDSQSSQPTPQPLMCIRYATLLKNWLPGKYDLQSKLVLDASINDGDSDFPAGEIKKDSQVFVSKPASDPNFLASPAQWQTVVKDLFVDNVPDEQTGAFKDDYFSGKASIEDNKYVLSVDETYKTMTFRQNPTIKVLSGPYFASLTARRIEGSSNQACYGLYVHYDYSLLGFYQFIVCEDQTFMVNLHANGQWETLLDWKKSETIQPGQTNRLGVVVNGSNFDFLINGQSVANLKDQRLYKGYVGFLVRLPAGAKEKFEFTDFTIKAP